MIKICNYCGKAYDGRSDSRFCSAKCKNSYHNKKRNGELEENVSGLENVSEDDDENDYLDEDTDQNTDFDSENEDSENVYDDDDVEEEDEDEEDENDYDQLVDEYNALVDQNESLRQQNARLVKNNSALATELNAEKKKRQKAEERATYWQDQYNESESFFNKYIKEKKSEPEPELKEPETKDNEVDNDDWWLLG